MQGHGDEVSTAESIFEVKAVPGKVQSFTAFTPDSDDDLNMTPPPSCSPVTPFNVKQTTKPSHTPAPTCRHPDQTRAEKEENYTAICAGNAAGSPENAKEMMLLKNEKLKIQVALLKEQTNSCTLIS
jgi:hypothetical protein